MATTAPAKKASAAKTVAAAKTGTAVAVKKVTSTSIVSIQEALRAQAAGMSERTAPASGISIRVGQDKTFTLPDGSKTPGPLQLVIVDFVARNEFYEGAYDPNNIAPPVCFAIGTNPLALIPSANAPALQSDSCGTCPMNVFGSAGTGKACKNTRVLAVLPPDGDADTPLWLLKLSPTALKGFDGYVSNIARTFQMPPVGVVTEVSLDPNSTYASLRFGDPIPNPQLAEHFARQDEARELLAREPDLTQRAAPAKPAARPVARKTAVAARR
jgi:hypothetical protein